MKQILLIFVSFVFIQVNAQFSSLSQASGIGVNGSVFCMKADTINDILYVGGAFSVAGGMSAPFIASWDGTSWSAIGNGFNGTVRDIFLTN